MRYAADGVKLLAGRFVEIIETIGDCLAEVFGIHTGIGEIRNFGGVGNEAKGIFTGGERIIIILGNKRFFSRFAAGKGKENTEDKTTEYRRQKRII